MARLVPCGARSTSRGGSRALVQLRRELAAATPWRSRSMAPRAGARGPGRGLAGRGDSQPLLPFHSRRRLLDDAELGCGADPEAIGAYRREHRVPLAVPSTGEAALKASAAELTDA